MSSYPPPPIQVPISEPDGFIAAPWQIWLQQLNKRLGGASGSPSDDALILADSEMVDQTARQLIQDLSQQICELSPRPEEFGEAELWGDIPKSTEPALGNPPADGDVLSSTRTGVRSWVPMSGGGASNLDGGSSSSIYGGTVGIDGGSS